MQHEYERQVSQLTMSIAAQEEAVRRGEEDKHSILQDLSAVRDLCTKLEATKDSLQRQLTARTLDQEKVPKSRGDTNKLVSFCACCMKRCNDIKYGVNVAYEQSMFLISAIFSIRKHEA